MAENLLSDRWTEVDSAELMLLLYECIGRPGQYRDWAKNPNIFYLPLAGESCRVKLTFRDDKISTVEPGPAFDAAEWKRISEEIERWIAPGQMKVGRGYTFSRSRVPGSWQGKHSGVHILPPPADAPRAPVEHAEHPFILEFLIKASDVPRITEHRLMREHRKLTLLLNVLLAGGLLVQPRRTDHFWAVLCGKGWPTRYPVGAAGIRGIRAARDGSTITTYPGTP